MATESGGEKSVREEEEKQRAMREGLLRMLLTSDARERLTNIRMVKPEVAKVIEDNIIRLASAGRLQPPVSDEDVKKLLISIQKPKREFKIRRV
ncbi:MAG: DNA-binding protein [Nitrososphaerales archaeon]